MSKATDALAFLDSKTVEVDAHRGAAYTEVELLRNLTENVPGNILQTAYLERMNFEVPSPQNRAEMYQATHEIFFATNFGRDVSLINDATKATWVAMLKNSLSSYTADMDVLAEILSCIHILGGWGANEDIIMIEYRAMWAAALAEGSFGKYHEILTGGVLFQLRGE